MTQFIKHWWPSFLTFAVVVYATIFPHPVGADELALFPGYDKLIHAIIMGGMASAVMFDYRRGGRILSKRVVIFVALCTAVFAFVDEWIQHIVSPNRIYDIWDILAGIGGIVIASFTAPPVINRIFRKK